MRTSLHWLLLFLAIQAVNLPLMLLGIPLVALCLMLNVAPPWLWNNSVDPAKGSKWQQFVWLALRNPVSNLRLLPGVSNSARPLWYWTWEWKVLTYLNPTGQWYFKAGWLPHTGYPCLSMGGGRGY